MIDKLQETVKAENWHGRLFTSRWKDEELSQDASFAWMKEPTYTVTGMIELYEQLLPSKVYTTQKTRTTQGDVSCRLCGWRRNYEEACWYPIKVRFREDVESHHFILAAFSPLF